MTNSNPIKNQLEENHAENIIEFKSEQIELSQEQKLQVLLVAWNDISSQIETVAGYENRITVSYVTFVAAFLYYLKGGTNSIEVSHLNILAVGILIVACFITTSFIRKNMTRLKWLCQSLIRIQYSLKMYDDYVYFKAPVSNSQLGKTVFGITGLEWGRGAKYLNSIPHLLMVVFATLSASAFILLS